MKRSVLLITSALSSGIATAVPAVIYDSGKTHSIHSFLKAFRPPIEYQSQKIPSRFPIRTPEFSVGVVKPRAIDQRTLSRPLFLVGSDPVSRGWLAKHKARLKKIHAVGMLIEAKLQSEVDTLKALANGLEIVAAPASDLANHLNLKHYPVLITKTQIEP